MCHAWAMIRAPLADLLTGSRLILGVMAADALIADRLLLFSIVLAGAWVTDAFDGRLARSADRPTRLKEFDMVADTWVGACVLAGLGLSGRAPLWLATLGIVVLGAIYLRTRNPAVSQVLQGIAYGAALWLIFTSPDTSLAIPFGTLAVLLILEYEKFFGKVLPMFFNGVAAFVRGERYEGPPDDSPVDIETGT